MHYSTLAERAGYFKENKEGTFNMCRSVEKLVAQASDVSRAEGRVENQVDNLRSLMDSLKVSIDKAMDLLKVPESEREMYRKLLAQ